VIELRHFYLSLELNYVRVKRSLINKKGGDGRMKIIDRVYFYQTSRSEDLKLELSGFGRENKFHTIILIICVEFCYPQLFFDIL